MGNMDRAHLIKAIARFERTLEIAAVAPDRVSDEAEWAAYEADCGILLEAARQWLATLERD